MKRNFRLTSSIDIQRVRRYGSSIAHPLLVLYFLEKDQKGTLFAVSAGKSVGKAVKRNRAKRLIRAALQDLFPQIKDGWDIVIVARKPLASANCQKTKKALESLFEKANLLHHADEN
ncbi:MAG: ribonuclease P protein component [Anaerolineales bacterium]